MTIASRCRHAEGRRAGHSGRRSQRRARRARPHGRARQLSSDRDAAVTHQRAARRRARSPVGLSLRALYIADLDAIEGSGDNDAVVRELHGEFPRVELWVDRGIADRRAAEDWLATGLGHMVLGSESLADAAVAQHFADDPRVILSLDFRAAAFQGPPALLAQPDDWPTRVIVMTLARVGSGAGPDLERLARDPCSRADAEDLCGRRRARRFRSHCAAVCRYCGSARCIVPS